MLDFLISFS